MRTGVIAKKVKHVSTPVMPIQSDYQQQFWQGRDVNRKSKAPLVDPQLSQAMSEFKARLSNVLAWPETVSPSLVNGFENGLHYQLVDPAKE